MAQEYCIECNDKREMQDMTSFSGRFPSLRYCTQCSRAYDRTTGNPLTKDGVQTVYFDKHFIDEVTDVPGGRIRSRLVTTREELTPAQLS